MVDIAGLIQGASKGEGLGNQFLASIRECTLLLHVVRCFDDPNVSHVIGATDPARDVDVIDMELILADLQQLEKAQKKSRRMPAAPEDLAIVAQAEACLTAGKPIRRLFDPHALPPVLRDLHLLTAKPAIVVLNLTDADFCQGVLKDGVQQFLKATRAAGDAAVLLSAQLETELAAMAPADAAAILADFGAEHMPLGVANLSALAYQTLQYQTFFTVGQVEARAWTVPRGATAPQVCTVSTAPTP